MRAIVCNAYGVFELQEIERPQVGSTGEADQHRDLLARWNDAQSAFYRRAWDEAIEKFEALLTAFPNDGPTEVFLRRAQEYQMERPAADWDGVYVAKTK